ncbi:RAS2 protein [Paramarasmius palmivorus]|uniref:RAS2 protein n=1 Tax=Paramarasmius palmivorus TaxID=297713 RepID=A0AAW0BJJ5_9AGAR
MPKVSRSSGSEDHRSPTQPTARQTRVLGSAARRRQARRPSKPFKPREFIDLTLGPEPQEIIDLTRIQSPATRPTPSARKQRNTPRKIVDLMAEETVVDFNGWAGSENRGGKGKGKDNSNVRLGNGKGVDIVEHLEAVEALHPEPEDLAQPSELEALEAAVLRVSSRDLPGAQAPVASKMDIRRVAMLGDGGVGKTALAVQTYDPTIEDAYRKQLVVADRMCLIEVIDTAGQEDYSTLRDQWIREAHGFALVYSVTDRGSFERMEQFRTAVLRIKQGAPIVLVGNKADKRAEREVSTEEGERLAQCYGCRFVETSTKTPANVELIFTELVDRLRENEIANTASNGGTLITVTTVQAESHKNQCHCITM